jgi:hypothetical protein
MHTCIHTYMNTHSHIHTFRLDAKRQQVAAALEKIQEEKRKIEEEDGVEAMEDMDEEERSEFVQIKKREFEHMEKMLADKQVICVCTYPG